MFSSFNFLDPSRHKSELNPIKGMVVYNRINGEHHKVISRGTKNYVPIISVHFAVSTDTPIRDFEMPEFWEYFTTLKNNLFTNP